jgi:hypothetical protein
LYQFNGNALFVSIDLANNRFTANCLPASVRELSRIAPYCNFAAAENETVYNTFKKNG